MRTIVNAFQDTRLVVQLWFRLLPNAKSKVVALALLPFLWFALWVSLHAGPSILSTARRGTGDSVGKYTANYVVALQDGDLGVLGMSVVGAVALAGFISPFTSGGNVTLIPDLDLLGIRPAKLHAYFSSILTTAVSIIGFFQLMALTLVSSLLSIDGDPFPTAVIGWLTWFPLLGFTVAQIWFTEWMLRGVRRRVRLALIGTIIATLTVAMAFFEGARAFVGTATNGYAALLRRVAQGDAGAFHEALAIIAGVTAIVVVTGLWLCLKAQALPAHTATKRFETILRLNPVRNPYLMFMQITVAQVVRNREVRRPMLVIFSVNLAGCWLVNSTEQQMSVMLTLPIAVGAAWGANMFGLLGPGLPWLASQPNLMRYLPAVTYPVQFIFSWLLCTVCWVLIAARHGIGLERFVVLELATIAVSALMTRAAFHHAVRHPTLVRLGGRGDTVVRPGQAIGYTLRYAPAAAMIGLLLTNLHSVPLVVAATVAVCCWVASRWYLSDRRWADEDVRAAVVRRVASA